MRTAPGPDALTDSRIIRANQQRCDLEHFCAILDRDSPGAFYFALRNIDLSLAHAFRQGFLISQPIDRSFAVQRRPKMRVFRSAAPDLDGAGRRESVRAQSGTDDGAPTVQSKVSARTLGGAADQG